MGRSEKEIIALIRSRSAVGQVDLLRGIGDDCAVIRRGGGLVELVSTDALLEGIHFDLSWHPPRLLGRKTAAVNLSDIAAMGGRPRYAFLSLGLPGNHDQEWLEEFMAGFLEMLAKFDTSLIGGDTVRSPAGTMLSVTVLGEAAESEVLLRSTARVGDLVLVSGPLGEAAAGLELCRQGRGVLAAERWPGLLAAHLDPQPELALARVLAASGLVGALMDLSDGLATDLANLCRESGVGAEVENAALPLAPATREAAEFLAGDARTWALSGGEDYRLLLTVGADKLEALAGVVRQELGRELHPVGRIVAAPGVRLREGANSREISVLGFDHFRG
ncbi:MAG: thiamine-phosphate kinase [Desulfobulbaceae bacterium]|nr:thiamine-phosphate kinase [Desulfobulbaceae bacterium]